MTLSVEGARRLRRVAAAAQEQHRLPSLVVAVCQGGQIVDCAAVGTADMANQLAPGADVQYRIGSITKTFTAVGVMQLVAEGRVALADPLGRHWTGAPHPELTIESLLAHTSGLQREAVADASGSGVLPSRIELPDNAAAARLLYPAGNWWHYSNLGFALLGELLAQVRGQDWETQIMQRIVGPLGMARTTVVPQPPAAQGYSVLPFADTVVPEPPGDSRGLAPAGQLWSTAVDLARWLDFLVSGNRDILDADTFELMRAPRVIADLRNWTMAYAL
ncbi:MAG: serine hydrolase domain-containing protein, partial [Candidatus Dormibacteria bacterium]